MLFHMGEMTFWTFGGSAAKEVNAFKKERIIFLSTLDAGPLTTLSMISFFSLSELCVGQAGDIYIHG